MSWSFRQTLLLLLRHTRGELRAGIKGFRLFLMCLVLGVGAFATILSTVEILSRSLDKNAALILGGDVELRQIHSVLDRRSRDVFEQQTKALSHISLLRTMARGVGKQQRSVLVELKAVDEHHPLLGGLILQGGREVSARALQTLLAEREGVWGALVAPAFLAVSGSKEGTRAEGTRFVLGEKIFEVRAVIQQESDLLSSSFPLGARVLLSQKGLDATGLRIPGSLIYEHYRMLLRDGEAIAEFRTRAQSMFPNASWILEDRRNAAPRVRQIIERLSLFMTLAALAGMFAGGAGIANGLTCLLRARRTDMALWKILGAPSRYIHLLLGLQTGVMGFLGIAVGCGIGVLVGSSLAPWVGARFSLPVDAFFPSMSLLRSAGVGFCVLVLFALLPFSQIDRVAPSSLLRAGGATLLRRDEVFQGKFLRLFLLAFPVFVLLCFLMVLGSSSPVFTLFMLLSFLLSLWIFPLASRGVLFLVRRARRRARRRLPLLDYALQQTRSSALLSIVLPLGLGLSLFVALAEVELSLTRDAETGLSEEAPRQFFIDLQPWQREDFRVKMNRIGENLRLEEAPMLRGRILSFNDIDAENLETPTDYEWVLKGDRGISFSSLPPTNAVLAEGEWWDAEYEGALLLSMDSDVARAFGLNIGDSVRVGVLDKVLEAKIANLRDIDWRTWQINFMMIFSPHPSLEELPFTILAAAFATDGLEGEVDAVMARDFPNVTMLRVGDFVSLIKSLLQGMTHAVRAVSALTLAVGVIVLSSAIVVEQQRRVYEAVVMKTLGISKRRILLTFFIEYMLVGGSVALLSIALGGLLGWAILRFAMDSSEVVFSLGVSFAIVLGVLSLSVLCSGVSGLMVLSRSSWSVLRNP